MASDYDAPRTKPEDETDSLEELKAAPRSERQSAGMDDDEVGETLELPGADLSGEELVVPLVPVQSDEFTCTQCFLVHHRSQLASTKGRPICRDCAAL
ncbi:MAG: hypothetical protein QOJ62_45 [Actinomycetota bacterium]|nr:hypothetical protein [Actinomycetota bacterium]